MSYCEFQQIDQHHVRCLDCKKTLSGTPERYLDKVLCVAKGVGTEFAKNMDKWAGAFNINYQKCHSCMSLEVQMNRHGPAWCRQYDKSIVEIVINNAKEQGIKIVGFGLAINNMLYNAIRAVEKRECNGSN